MSKKQPLIKRIGTDIAGVICLLLVPFLGPIPGPGGIPLLLTGLGLLAINHEWARNWLHYVKKHSNSVRDIMFPDVGWIKWAWDLFVLFLIGFGTWLNIIAEHWFWKGISIGILAGSTTIFMLNRERIVWLDNKIKELAKRQK